MSVSEENTADYSVPYRNTNTVPFGAKLGITQNVSEPASVRNMHAAPARNRQAVPSNLFQASVSARNTTQNLP